MEESVTEVQQPRESPKVSQRVQEPKRSRPPRALFKELRSRTTARAGQFLGEGVRQFQSSASSLTRLSRGTVLVMRGAGRGLWTFLTQPVWIIRPHREPKRYSRITLFLLDTVRFGGTFAALFLILFVSLNYQSFWQIMQSRLDPFREMEDQTGLGGAETATLRDKLLKSPMLATAGQAEEGDLLSYLPPVGPPENRLIIPKMNLNVPIMNPPVESLLREDWTQVEADIQKALEGGVVHYPGTAKPGQAGNFFLTGHSSYYPWSPGKYKTVFARLHDLKAGDDYWVYYGGDKHRYVVTDVSEVKPSNVDVLDQPANRRLSTLMTCTPVGTTLRRLIIAAEEVDPATGQLLAVGQQPVHEMPKIKMEMLPI